MSTTQPPKSVCDLLSPEILDQLEELVPTLPHLPPRMLRGFVDVAREYLRSLPEVQEKATAAELDEQGRLGVSPDWLLSGPRLLLVPVTDEEWRDIMGDPNDMGSIAWARSVLQQWFILRGTLSRMMSEAKASTDLAWSNWCRERETALTN